MDELTAKRYHHDAVTTYRRMAARPARLATISKPIISSVSAMFRDA